MLMCVLELGIDVNDDKGMFRVECVNVLRVVGG